MKKILLLASCLLTACATTTVIIEGMKTNDTVLSRDRIVGFGYPQTPVPGFEGAVVFLGEKYSYFATPDADKQDPQLFQRIMGGLDMNYTRLELPMEKGVDTLALYQKLTPASEQELREFSETIAVVYERREPLTAEERQRLAALKFKCRGSRCYRVLHGKITVAQLPRNRLDQQWSMGKPLFFEIRRRGEHKQVGLFLPLALTYDLITLPVQVLAVSVAGAME